jgi:hypothetical protein
MASRPIPELEGEYLVVKEEYLAIQRDLTSLRAWREVSFARMTACLLEGDDGGAFHHRDQVLSYDRMQTWHCAEILRLSDELHRLLTEITAGCV